MFLGKEGGDGGGWGGTLVSLFVLGLGVESKFIQTFFTLRFINVYPVLYLVF